MKDIKTTPAPQDAENSEEAQDQEIDALIDGIIKLAECEEMEPQDRLCAIAGSLRPAIAEFDPAARREFVAAMAMDAMPQRKKTGQFFNALAGAQQKRPDDYSDLGRRIMEKRNPHYHP